MLFSKSKLLTLFAKYVKLWKDLAFLLTLVLNIFIIFSYSDVIRRSLNFGIDLNEGEKFILVLFV